MKLSLKVIIFVSTIFLIATLFIYSTVNENFKNIIEFENKLVESNVKNLLDNIYLNNEEIVSTLENYSYNTKILNLLKKEKDENFQELFIRDNFTHLFLLNDKKEIIKGGVYNKDSEEFYYTNETPDFFKYSRNLLKKDKIYFTTYNYEKIIFNTITINNPELNFKYIIIGKALNSKFLSFITRLSNSYVSIYFDYNLKKENKILSKNNLFFYDIKRDDNNTLYTYIQLKDEINNSNFYLSMKVDRVYFSKIMKNNKKIFYVFIIAVIFLLIASYIFIYKFFTHRIELITNNVKKVSQNKELKTKITMNYNDEITYLANKINDMLISIDISQHEKIKKERDFLQSVLDAQQSIILITDGNNIKSTNKRFNEHFDSKELFLTNIALLDDKAKNNFLEIVKNYNSYDKPAKIKISDNKDGYFIFDIKKIDFKNYIINMNDISKLNQHISILKHKASFDELTQIYNKSTVLSIAEEWFKYKEFTTIIVDIDFFKKINDTYGHVYGDYILRDCSDILKTNLRENDILGRFGGEEFIILIENSTIRSIESVCNNLRKKIQNHKFIYDKKEIQITASFGFSLTHGKKSFQECFKLADEALYSAKKSGRNKVCNF